MRFGLKAVAKAIAIGLAVCASVLSPKIAQAKDSFKMTDTSVFRIHAAQNEYITVDAFGDNLPRWKTKGHMYSSSGSYNTSELIAYFQPQFNNSFEIHAQNDRNVCFGPNVNSSKEIVNGFKLIGIVIGSCLLSGNCSQNSKNDPTATTESS